MFSSIVPAGAAHTCRHKTPEKAKEHPASNKRKERSDEGRVKHPTRTKASDSRSSQPLQKPPDIREVSRDPNQPLLKRRRIAASDSTPKRDCNGSDLQANAAEARARNLLKRGIGDLATSAELETEAAKQIAAGTREYFGASAAAKLRKQIAASPAPPARTSDGSSSKAATSEKNQRKKMKKRCMQQKA